MDPERETTVLDLLRQALERPLADRERFVTEAAGGDEALRARLLDLLRRDALADDVQEGGAARLRGEASDQGDFSPRRQATEKAFIARQLAPGTVLDDFLLVRSIGIGGMGQVWEAEQRSLGRRVALKLLKPDTVYGPEELRQFQQEAESAGCLAHPGIVTVHTAGTVDGVPYIAQELIEGGRDLRQWVQERREQGPPPGHYRDAVQYMAKVADAVQAAHDAGVMHRDLKPRNIMLRADGSPVVLDFGLAGLFQGAPGELTGRLVGSPPYLSPEQVTANEVGKDPRTDVYQLGVTLYELLVLRPAFRGSDFASLATRIEQGDFLRPRAVDTSLPWELEAICLRAMERRPDRRYASAAALRDDLQRFLEGREVPHAARGGRVLLAWRRLPYWLRRHRVGAAATAAVAAGLLAGVWLWNGQTAPTFEGMRYTGPEGGAIDWERLQAGGGRKVSWAASDEVRSGHLLGFDLELPTPATVYTLSVFGQRSPPTWLLPTEPRALLAGDAADANGRPPEHSWGLSLPAGPASLVASSVGQTSDAVAYEGLLVLVSDDPLPFVERWLDQLDRQADTSPAASQAGQPAVSWETARKLFEDTLRPTRGRSPRLSSAQAVALSRLGADAVLGPKDITLPGTRRFEVMFRVVR